MTSSTTSQTNQPQTQAKPRASRGFADMDRARQREIASQGGRAAHEKGTAHKFTSEEARAAGLKSHSRKNAAKQAAMAANSNKPEASSGDLQQS